VSLLLLFNAQTKLQYDAWIFFFCVLVKNYSLLIMLSHMPQEVDGKSYKEINSFINFIIWVVSGTIIRGTLKTPNSQLVTPISIKLLRPDGCD
jgi:cell division protein FtsW (lipid II flippase)